MFSVEHNITIANFRFFPIKIETINDVFYYLNKLDFSDKVTDDDYENLRCVKRILAREFKEYNLIKLIQVLNIVDHLFVLFTIGSLDDILDGTHTLKENIFYLFSFIHFVNKNEEICNCIHMDKNLKILDIFKIMINLKSIFCKERKM